MFYKSIFSLHLHKRHFEKPQIWGSPIHHGRLCQHFGLSTTNWLDIRRILIEFWVFAKPKAPFTSIHNYITFNDPCEILIFTFSDSDKDNEGYVFGCTPNQIYALEKRLGLINFGFHGVTFVHLKEWMDQFHIIYRAHLVLNVRLNMVTWRSLSYSTHPQTKAVTFFHWEIWYFSQPNENFSSPDFSHLNTM